MFLVYKLEEDLAASVLGLGFIPHVLWRGAASRGALSGMGHWRLLCCLWTSVGTALQGEVCSVKCSLGSWVTASAYSSLAFRSPERAACSNSVLQVVLVCWLRWYWGSPGVSFSAACLGEVAVLPECSGSFADSSLCTWFPQHGKIHLNATSTKKQCLQEPCLVLLQRAVLAAEGVLGCCVAAICGAIAFSLLLSYQSWNFWC